MNNKSIILKDRSYRENNVAIAFKLKNTMVNDGESIFYFTVIITYEHEKILTELAVFKDDIDNLKNFKITEQVNEFYFYEPDISFLVVDIDDLYFFINLDSGLRHSNMCTDSGVSLRMNISVESLEKFISDLVSIV